MSITDKLTTIAENEQKVYEAGKTAEWSEFWDSVVQSNGKIQGVSYAFYNCFWNDNNFKPKYDIVFGYDQQVRAFELCHITDLRGILEKCGVTITFGGGNFTNTFANSKITRLPEMYIQPKSYYAIFYNCTALESIQKLKTTNTSPNYIGGTSMFYNCTSLKEIEIEGTIFASITFQYSPLNTASIVSIIESLSSTTDEETGEYTVTGQTLTLKQTAVDAMEFPFTSGQSGNTYNSWDELIAAKPNWTVSLV